MGFSNTVHLRPLKGTYLNITMMPLIIGFQMLVLGPGSLLHLEALGPLHVRCQDTLNWNSRGTYLNPGKYTAGGGPCSLRMYSLIIPDIWWELTY